MSHGIDLKNKNGRLIVEPGESPLQYWGKKRIGFSGNNKASLFNIPDHFSCAIYTTTISGSGLAIAYLVKSEGVWKATHHSLYGDATMDVYVFVQASALPRSSWGVEVFDDNGLVFNGYRPILSLKKIERAWVDTGHNTNHSNLVTESGKLAVSPFFMWRKALTGGRYNLIFDFNVGAYFDGGKTSHGVRKGNVLNTLQFFSYGAAKDRNYAVIDASYYDKFSSLGNYS